MSNSKNKSFSNIGLKSFLTVVIILTSVLIISGALSYFIPQGSFERDGTGAIIPGTYQEFGVGGIAIWRIVTAPARVFVSEDSITIIMISVFLLVMSGVFNLIDKTGGIVQGMSGASIVQNGKIIGAVTHVLVRDSKRGYGIFIEDMMEQ